jgi:hypothetical protein
MEDTLAVAGTENLQKNPSVLPESQIAKSVSAP